MTTSTVRVATPDDEEGVMTLCRLLHAENALFPMDETKVREHLVPALNRETGIVGVIGERDQLQGCIVMFIDNMWYSTDGWHLLEVLNFVHPDHRCPPGHAKALIEFAKHCSDELGMPLMIGIISNVRTEAKVRLYQRQLPQAGALFLYNGVTGRAGAQANGQ